MPLHDAHTFVARVANDDSLILRLVTGTDEEIQAVAANMGLTFTANELKRALQTTLDPAELDDSQLEQVVGGVDGAERERLERLLASLS